VRILPGLRAEELIGAGRLILALGLLLAITGEDQAQPERHSLSIDLLAVYAVLAAVIFAGVSVAKQRMLRFRVIIHALDLTALTAVLSLTGGASGGYFSTLFFPIVAGALRWRETGALQTGAAVLLLFTGLSVYDFIQGDLDPNTWLVRTAALVATILVLGHIRAFEKRFATQIATLGTWPGLEVSDPPALAEAMLQRAAEVFGATRGVIVMDEPEEPWVNVFVWKDGRLSHSRQHHSLSEISLIPEGMEETAVLLGRRGTGVSAAFLGEGDLPDVRRGVLPDWLRSHLDGETVLALSLLSGSASAYLFLLDPPDVTVEDLPVARVLARHVSDSLEQARLSNELRLMTASEERVRLSRNLHDGVLQTLSGIAMNLATVRHQYELSPDKARRDLEALERLLLDEQRDLRFFTEELRLRSGSAIEAVNFPHTLRSLLQRLETIWSVKVEWHPSDLDHVPPHLSSDVYQLVHEAVVNASRHGRATHITLRITIRGPDLRIAVLDNGGGFPFKGRLTLPQMIAEKRGPRSLRERVAEVGGNLVIDSSADGAQLEILIPVAEALQWR
jgi:signal transduction histidine kinase